MNGYVFLFVSGYLFIVLKNKNATKFINEITNESDFVKWAIALSIVMMVSDKLGKAGGMLKTLVYVGMFISAIGKNKDVFKNLSSVLSVGNTGGSTSTY